MLKILSVLTFLWLATTAWWALRRVRSRGNTSVDVLLLALFFFFGVPLALDLLFSPPQYLDQPGMFRASQDPMTRVVSCLYVALCAATFWIGRGRAAGPLVREASAAAVVPAAVPRRFVQLVRRAATIAALLPVAFLLLTPEPELYVTYGMSATEVVPATISDWHNALATLTVLSVLAVVVHLSLVPRLGARHVLASLPLVFFDCWVNGKRAIVAIALLTLGHVFWSRGWLSGRRLWIGAAAGFVLLMGFSVQYQTQVRFMDSPFHAGGARELYDSLRIDFFRDSRVEMAVYATLEPDRMQIVEYPGQTLLFDAAFFVPRSAWPDKPWPYAVYFTSAMLDIFPARSIGWGMTTSWLDEMVSNFGLAGMLLAPLSLLGLCRLGDSFRWPTLSLLTSLVAVLFLALQLSAFLAVFLLWIGLAASVRLRTALDGAVRPASAPPPARRRRVA
jgi:hypothetical protein